MTLRAWTFALLSRHTGELLGMAVICPEARYVTAAWKGEERLERRHATPSAWRSLEADLQTGFPGGAVPWDAAVATVLATTRAAVDIGFVSELPVIIGEPSDAIVALDGALRQQVPA